MMDKNNHEPFSSSQEPAFILNNVPLNQSLNNAKADYPIVFNTTIENLPNQPSMTLPSKSIQKTTQNIINSAKMAAACNQNREQKQPMDTLTKSYSSLLLQGQSTSASMAAKSFLPQNSIDGP